MVAARAGCRRFILFCVAALSGFGCAHRKAEIAPPPNEFHERNKATLSEYTIEAPDILQIDLLHAVPLPPYLIQSLDLLAITVANTPATEPIAGVFAVDPDGTVALGGRYGSVTVAGLTPEAARLALEKQLSTVLKDPKVSLSIAQGRGVQLIRGQHLVRPDGTVSLGTYGSVRVSGRTLTEAKAVIEEQLRMYLQNPEVVVNVVGFNSKVFYLIYDLGGTGQQLVRLPFTGNDTVLDAVSQVYGLSAVSDTRRVWVARSACPGQPSQILPVNWNDVTKCGRPETNYQLFPNDRLYVQAYPLVSFDTKLARLLNPIERLLGVTLLGTFTVDQLGPNNGTNGLGGF